MINTFFNRRRAATFLLCASTSSFAWAHHSPSAFDTAAEVTFVGEIIEYSFRNPHVYLTLSVKQRDGSVNEVEVEAGAGSVIRPLGFSRDSVAIGDVVTVVGSPAKRNPDKLMLGRELYKQDGSYYPLHIQSRSNYEAGDETATSIEGTWFAARESFYGYLGESREWPHTPKGRDAMLNIDPQATPQKDCVPLASPTLMLYPVAKTVTVMEDRVIFKMDWLGAERTVWLDGRNHPDASQTFVLGHSTGHWDGDALVIDTTNYADHSMGLSLYVPGGKQKHLTERVELNEDGKGITYSGTIVDPEYLTEPVTWSGQWGYRPNMEFSNEECDLEVAHRFLDD